MMMIKTKRITIKENHGLIFVVLVKKKKIWRKKKQTNISHKVKTLLDVDCACGHACLRAFKDRC